MCRRTQGAAIGAALLALALGIGGCQPPPAASTTAAAGATAPASPTKGLAGIAQTLQKFTVADLQAADADAKVHGDTVAATCYEALVPIVQSQASPLPGAAPAGAVTAFQQARDGLNAVEGIPSALKGLNVPCGPLVVDAEQTLIQLGLKIAPAALPAIPVP